MHNGTEIITVVGIINTRLG